MKAKINEMKSKLNLRPSRALTLVGFFGPKKNCLWPSAATWPRAAKQTQKALRDPFRDSNMADAAWKKNKRKVTAKRGKKSDVGDATHQLLKGNGRRVQRLSWRAQKYAPFTEDEREHQPFCERHFATQVATFLVCNILAADQGPS